MKSKRLAIFTLVVAFTLVAGSAMAAMTFSSNSITTDSTISLMGGNVGIGTTSPDNKLVIVPGGGGHGLTISSYAAGSEGDMVLGDFWGGSSTDYASHIRLAGGVGQDLYISPGQKTSDSSSGNIVLGVDGPNRAGTVVIGGSGGTAFDGTVFRLTVNNTAGAQKMVVLENGNVGIGNTSPLAILDIDSNHDFQFLPSNTYGTGPMAGTHPAISTKYGGLYMGLAASDPSYGVDVNPLGLGQNGTRILSYSQSGFCFTDTYPTVVCPVIVDGNGQMTMSTLQVTGGVILEKSTGTVSTNAVTISKTSGVITDSTDINTDTTRAAITLTNTRITATSVVVASICSTPDAGARLGVAITPGSGSAAITVYNSGTANQTSDYKICFIVTN